MAGDTLGPDWTRHGAEWAAQDALFDRVFAPATAAVVEAAGLTGTVLDIGCGGGTLLEEAVKAGAGAVGVDVSPSMIDAARARVPSATTIVADAQTADLASYSDGGFDRLVSRFGVMFFPDPRAAFANLHSVTAPDGTLTFVCWQQGRENPMFTLGTRTLVAALDDPPQRPEPRAPGPIAFAEPEYVHEFLSGAGWRGVRVDDLTFTADYSVDGSDGVEERLAVILATSTGQSVRDRVGERLGQRGWADLVEKVRNDLRGHLVDGVLTHECKCWLVTAHA